jgi:hypothetical protein
MILSPTERLNIKNTYDIVCNVNSSLKYQIQKIRDICERVELELDKSRDTWYIESADFGYNVDFIINSFSVLIEYYHTWVIQQRIGLIEPNVKISYKAMERGDDEAVNDVLRKYKVGKTERDDLYKFNFYEKCKSEYLSAMDFFLMGKNHEIFVLNNYMKHNHMMRNHAPLSTLGNDRFSFPYLYIDNNRGRLLNRSLLRYLLNHTLDELKESVDDKYYKKYVLENNVDLYSMGGLNIIVINGLEYVKSENIIGLSIESILESIKLTCVSILDEMVDDLSSNGITGGTDMDEFSVLRNHFNIRKNKTIRNSLDTKNIARKRTKVDV